MTVLVINKTPLGEVPTECTYALVSTALALGHEVHGCRMADVAMTEAGVHATTREVCARPNGSFAEAGTSRRRPLRSFDAVVNRHDPPVDLAYVSLLLALRHAEAEEGVLVCNSAEAVLRGSEKTLALAFPDLTPPTLVSSDADAIRAFRAEHGAVVLKPLYDCGGHGVRVVLGDDDMEAHLQALLSSQSAPIVAQRFLPEVVDGDTRVLYIDGQVVGAFKRIPRPGTYVANLCAGGRLAPARLTPAEARAAETVGHTLRQWGVVLCGADFIGGRLTELNVTSTVGVRQLRTLYGHDVAPGFWTAIEGRLDPSGHRPRSSAPSSPRAPSPQRS